MPPILLLFSAELLTTVRGVATGGISVYIPPKSVYLKFFCGCFVSLTQDKFDIVQFIPTQIKFLATPLTTVYAFF